MQTLNVFPDDMIFVLQEVGLSGKFVGFLFINIMFMTSYIEYSTIFRIDQKALYIVAVN